VLGAQEIEGVDRIKVKWVMRDWDGWDLSGKLTEAFVETP